MAITATISPSPASRVWHGRCAPPSRSIRRRWAKSRPPRARSAADVFRPAARAVCGITEFLGTGHRHVRLHSSCSLTCRSRSARDRQVRLRARRLPFLGDDLRTVLAAVESAVAGAGRLADLRCRLQCRAIQPRRRPVVDPLRRHHSRAADGIRSLQPAPLDAVARKMATARRGDFRRRGHRRAPLLRALEPEAARHRQRSMGRRARRPAADPQRAGSAILQPAANAGGWHHWFVSGTGRVKVSVAIIDYGSGNLHSAAKAFERAARSMENPQKVFVTSDPDQAYSADRLVLPGVGAFADCRRGLDAVNGMVEAITEAVRVKARPMFGICVGMQLFATRGKEHVITQGLNWIGGDVEKITPRDESLKIPHMGWNTLDVLREHPVLDRLPLGPKGQHAYFVHSYHLNAANEADVLARADYGGPVTAIVGKDTAIGTQFHPEKSQRFGLALISNFLRWKP